MKQPRVNQQIRAKEIRVLTEDGENLGLLQLADALKAAEERNADLIEISPNAIPPVGKIMDFGKYQYLESKKNREIKQKSHTTETKSVQIRIETGENDMLLKAKKTAEWLREGHRVKVDLFLKGRYKYMEFNFLKERLERFIKIIPEEYKLAVPIEKSPKGLSTVVERVKVKKS